MLQVITSTHRNQLYVNTLTVNNLKRKLIKQAHLIASKRTKYFGINLTKKLNNLYTENYKTKQEMKEDTNK